MNVQDIVILSGAGATVVMTGVRILQLRSHRRADELHIKRLENDLRRDQANRLAQLQAYADATMRWRRVFRQWLESYIETGAIDMSRIDMSTMPPLPELPVDPT